MRTFKMPFKTTRGALEQTLLTLGYVPTYGKNSLGFPYVEFRHQEANALVEMRAVPANDPLAAKDLLVAEHSVEWCGVSDVASFYRLLKEQTPEGMVESQGNEPIVIVLQPLPENAFTEEQVTRLRQLIGASKIAPLSDDDQAEMEALVNAELFASAQFASALATAIGR